jgi:AcrR family transcriptional regulator
VSDELPDSVAAAWGLRDAPTRPRPRGLSLGRIVEAGLRVAESDGLPAVSMARVAAELGVATMSLYRHVSAKDELVSHMVDAVYASAPADPTATETWRDGLRRWATLHIAVLRRHAWVVRVPISSAPLMPHAVRWFECGLRCLRDTKLAPHEKPSVLLLVNGFVRNQALLEADLAIAARAAGSGPEAAGAAYGRQLGRLVDPDGFPALTDLLAAGVFTEPATGDDFAFGLDRILDGIEVLVRARDDR